MSDKLVTLEQAAAMVQDQDQVVMNSGDDGSPLALLRQLVRQGVRGLRAVGVVGGGVNLDLLIGAEAASSVDTCSIGLDPFARTGPNFARYLQAGRLQALDNT
jgi:glutaconate CoA-transferase subunit A